MLRLLLSPAHSFPVEHRVFRSLRSGGLARFPVIFQRSKQNPQIVSFSSSIVPISQLRNRIGSLFATSRNEKWKENVIYRTFLTRGNRHRGKAVTQYRDPSDEFGRGPPGEQRFQERNSANKEPEEEKPSINLKNFDVNSYRGWDAVDDSEVAPPPVQKKKVVRREPIKTPFYASTTSQMTSEVIYDGRATIQDLGKAKQKKKARREAQSKPLHPLCRTCIVCNRQFQGHGSMLAHLMNAPKCYDQLEPEMKMALFDHKEGRIDKKTRAQLRKRGFLPFDSGDDNDDDQVKRAKPASSNTTTAVVDPVETKEENDVKKSDEP
jgi:hypothetical protein